jgi:hypothetical protein
VHDLSLQRHLWSRAPGDNAATDCNPAGSQGVRVWPVSWLVPGRGGLSPPGEMRFWITFRAATAIVPAPLA